MCVQGAYGNLGLKNSLHELSQEMAGEMESDSESEDEELVPTDDSEATRQHEIVNILILIVC